MLQHPIWGVSIMFPKAKVKDDLSLKEMPRLTFQNTADRRHSIAWNANPFLKWKHHFAPQTNKTVPWMLKNRGSFSVLGFECCGKTRGSASHDQRALPTPLLQLEEVSPRSCNSLTYLSWGEERGDLWPPHPPQHSARLWKRKRPTTEPQWSRSITITSR